MVINKGDTIGIIALSGECDKEKIEQAKANIEALGYKVKLSKNIFDKNRYLAGSDEDKLEELYKFFEDSEIKLILCARGGYGAIRLINKIDYNIIKSNPKPFCGFSDVTALLLMIYKKTGIITYHSPMAQSDFATNYPSPLTPLPKGEGKEKDAQSDFADVEQLNTAWNNFISTINNADNKYIIPKYYKSGNAEGILWGGNLSTVVSLCGQDFIPDRDFIFFTEDLNEPVYKIDKMFQQLINIEQFKNNCKGIILGDFLDVDNETWLEEYFLELAQRLDIPVIHIDGITHGDNKITLPIGAKASVDNDNLKILKDA